MKYVYDDDGKIIGYDFSDNELEAIKVDPEMGKVITEGFVNMQKEITNRTKIFQEESTNRAKIFQEESTNRAKIFQEEDTKRFQIINAQSLGILPN